MKSNDYITTYTGKKFYPFNPDPFDIDIVDIAHSLSNKARWNAHTIRLYTVGAHSVQAARRVAAISDDPNLIKAALLHDASEAYFADVPTPIKKNLQNVIDMEDSIQATIEVAFKLPAGILNHEIIKRVDKECLHFEANHLLNKVPDHLKTKDIPKISNTIDSPDWPDFVLPIHMNKLFLDTFYAISSNLDASRIFTNQT